MPSMIKYFVSNWDALYYSFNIIFMFLIKEKKMVYFKIRIDEF